MNWLNITDQLFTGIVLSADIYIICTLVYMYIIETVTRPTRALIQTCFHLTYMT